MIIGYSVQFLETYFFGIGIDLPVSIVIYSCGVILILFSTHTEKLFNKFPKYLEWLASIGRYSFVIYLIHLYVLLFFYHFVATNYWSIKWLCASILSYASVWLLDKVVPNKQKKYIGLY